MILLNIITPATRLQNLPIIHSSIFNNNNNNIENIHVAWDVIVDGPPSDYIPFVTMGWDVYFKSHPTNGTGVSGNPQRNVALDIISYAYNNNDDNNYVYFLDDDTILHPRYLQTIIRTIKHNPGKAIITDQINKDSSIRLTASPDNMKVCHIDTAQYTLPVSMIKNHRWSPFDYCADGHFIEGIYQENKDKFIFINEPLCFYNYLR